MTHALMPVLRACAGCAAPFTPRHARHRHCAICERHGNEHRSPTTRTRPSSSTERERIRQEVLNRDGHVCQLRLDGCTITATVADHVIPAQRGGRYEATNLRAACHHCNSVAGGRQTAALQHGQADRGAGRVTTGDARPAYGPTRLA